MGHWKIRNISIFVILIIAQQIGAVCNDAPCCVPRQKLRNSLKRKGYTPKQVNKRLARADVKARMRQAKWGLEYEASNPWWPEDPRYPVPYLFYRESPTTHQLQVDFGFNRW
jgi:hypothetical protein